jgi:hypothetical protein
MNRTNSRPSLARRIACALALFLGVPLLLASRVDAAAVRMAVMGDSISAGSSQNWIGHLNSSFPGTVTFQNKAQGGATTDTVISGQLNSVITLAASNQIDNSVLIIGGNNATGAADDFPNLTPFINNYVNDVIFTLSAVAAANPNVKQVFGNMPDVTVTPLVQSQAASLGITPADLQLLSGAIGAANNQANAWALSHNIPVIDLYTASHTVLQGNSFPLGGHTYTTAFASDGFHPARWVQGLLANMVTEAFNSNWGSTLPTLSDQQIVTNTGFTPSGSPTFFDVTPFILLPVPEPSSWVLASLGAMLLGWRASRRRRR